MRISDWSSDVCSSDLAGAVDDERRRVLGARMGETQLGDVAAYHRRRVGLVGDLERAGDFRGAELARGRIMCAMDGAEQLAQAGAVHGAESPSFGPGHKSQLARTQGPHLGSLVVPP